MFFGGDGGDRNVQVLVQLLHDFFRGGIGFGGLPAQRGGRNARKLFGASGKDQFRQRLGESFFEGYRAGKTPRFLRPAFGKDIGDLTVGAVLQQTRKE